MSKFTDYIDGFADKTGTLAKDELKELIISAKKDESEFVRLQAENIELWTVQLATGGITPAGFKKLVSKMDVLAKLETNKLEVAAKASGAPRGTIITTSRASGCSTSCGWNSKICIRRAL